jgi:hypothetical protein
MPSTYTSNLGIELPADGEQDGVWGDVVNDNMNILDRAINGSVVLSLSGTSSTLTTSDGTLSNGQYKALILGGSPSGTHTITIAPNDAQKIYFVYNLSGQSAVFTQGSGTNVTIANGDTGVIYSDGGGGAAGVVNLTDHFAMNSVKITGGTIAGITDLAVADGGTGASSAADARTNLGLVIGTNVQAYDAELSAIAALAVTDSNFIVGNGTTWVAESGATARTSLGLGSIATQASNSVSITGGSITGITDLAVADGGTGASDAAGARTNLGLGTMATQASSSVSITGGSISGITDLAIADGGTGASDASGARTNLGLGTMATQAASSVSITGGSISGITDLAVADGGTGSSTASGARTNLGLAIGTDVQAQITGGATTITSSNLTASRALASDGSGKVAVSSVTDTELGYVSGVTSAIQTQLSARYTSANLSSQAQAEAGTDNTTLMTPLRTAQAIAALAGLQNISVATSTASSPFTIPAGVTSLYVIAVAGGGGGGGGYNSGTRNPTIRTGGYGGHGAEAISYLTGQTPGATISYTIGAGGAGNNSGTGSTGGTTTTGAISCTGGAGGTSATSTQAGTTGADGTATGANISNSVVFSSLWGALPLGNSLVEDSLIFSGQNFNRPPATSSTAAIAYSATGTNQPGAGGGPETGSTADASGGVGGCVIFIY